MGFRRIVWEMVMRLMGDERAEAHADIAEGSGAFAG